MKIIYMQQRRKGARVRSEKTEFVIKNNDGKNLIDILKNEMKVKANE